MCVVGRSRYAAEKNPKSVYALKVKSLPDIFTVAEVKRLIDTTRKLRYRVFLLATYSMGLRLGETLSSLCIRVVIASSSEKTGWVAKNSAIFT